MGHRVDRKTLDSLVLDHLPAALRLATRLTGDVDRAEDVVQEALTRVFASWKSFRGDSQFRTWLFRIVINVFRDQLKKQSRETRLPTDASDCRRSPVEETIAHELSAQIVRAVASLPLRQREVVVLSALEGFSTRQIAETLSISEANVYANLHAGRRRLQRLLRPHLEGKQT